MKQKFYLSIFLAWYFPYKLFASEIEVSADIFEVTPVNLNSTGICIKYEDTGSPYLRAKIGLPKTFKDKNFNLANVTIKGERGERTSIEVVPALTGLFYEVLISSVRHDGTLDNLKLEAVYGDSTSIPFVVTLYFKAFREAFNSSNDIFIYGKNCNL
ncbi:hypothetical protein [Microbulbifer sp. TYP-18]|uniref:hypothetical protein n=1 Tax=Microbulbifer sp. TYP-18 TaxID=3230024 RepID=UPI0034C6D406